MQVYQRQIDQGEMALLICRQEKIERLIRSSSIVYQKWEKICIEGDIEEMKKLVFSDDFQEWNSHLFEIYRLSESQKQIIKQFYFNHIHYCMSNNMEAIQKIYYSQAIGLYALNGDIDGIRNCVINGGDINYRGFPPHLTVLECLQCRPLGETQLDIVCYFGTRNNKLEVIKFLIENGGIVSTQSILETIIHDDEIIGKYLLNVYLSYDGEKNYKLMECFCQISVDISYIKMFIENDYEYNYQTLKEYFDSRNEKLTKEQLNELQEAYTIQRRKYFLGIVL